MTEGKLLGAAFSIWGEKIAESNLSNSTVYETAAKQFDTMVAKLNLQDVDLGKLNKVSVDVQDFASGHSGRSFADGQDEWIDVETDNLPNIGQDHILWVDGNVGDVLTVAPDWTASGAFETNTATGTTYTLYQSNAANSPLLYVDTDIAVARVIDFDAIDSLHTTWNFENSSDDYIKLHTGQKEGDTSDLFVWVDGQQGDVLALDSEWQATGVTETNQTTGTAYTLYKQGGNDGQHLIRRYRHCREANTDGSRYWRYCVIKTQTPSENLFSDGVFYYMYPDSAKPILRQAGEESHCFPAIGGHRR
ncbi:hypothetical protein [Neisseria sp.]|uniref:hypothetical protein n=1 Tax=Neisseria sp. TaxID=192066 RepID=UPI0035A0EBBC